MKPSAFDVWVEGQASYFRNDRVDGRRQGHASLLYFGADYLAMPGLLLGVMGQLDWMNESALTAQKRDGRGWMAGPYLGARLTPNLYFDARLNWGRSSNEVDFLGSFTDKFDTDRALASARLTGDWAVGPFRLRPSAEVIYYQERQNAYQSTAGIPLSAETYTLGRAVFGPELGYRWTLLDKSVMEPFVGLRGIWDFSRTEETTAAGTPIAQDALRGRIEAGASYRTSSGMTIRASGAYDGVGSSGFHAYQGQALMIVPLQ